MWFHLSKTRWPKDEITDLRQTEQGFGEPEVSRFSVAPAVGRAYIACPHSREGEPLFIYQIHVKNPVPTTATADHEMTREHLITADVLADEGGRIPVTLIGEVLVGVGEAVHLKLAYRKWGLDMTGEEEQQVLWEVAGGVWRLCRQRRDEAALKLSRLRSHAAPG